MSDVSHTAYFGDGERTFALPPQLITELERKTGTGIGALIKRVTLGEFRYVEVVETIRLGLIGGGTSPNEAQTLIDAYVPTAPFERAQLLAIDILSALWFGKPADTMEGAANG